MDLTTHGISIITATIHGGIGTTHGTQMSIIIGMQARGIIKVIMLYGIQVIEVQDTLKDLPFFIQILMDLVY